MQKPLLKTSAWPDHEPSQIYQLGAELYVITAGRRLVGTDI